LLSPLVCWLAVGLTNSDEGHGRSYSPWSRDRGRAWSPCPPRHPERPNGCWVPETEFTRQDWGGDRQEQGEDDGFGLRWNRRLEGQAGHCAPAFRHDLGRE